MDIECNHERVEEGEGFVFCVECGFEIDRFFGFSSRHTKKKKEKKHYCGKCDKSFLKEQGLQRHLKSKNRKLFNLNS